MTLAEVEIFVLDEADQMLDMGFIHAIRKIIAHAADEAPDPVLLGHHAEGDRRPGRTTAAPTRSRVEVAPVATTAERVEQSVIHVEPADKRALLAELLKDER